MTESKPRQPRSVKSGSPSGGKLDLGLGALIEPSTASWVTTAGAGRPSAETVVEPVARPAGPAAPPSCDYAVLAAAERWTELLELTERRTAGGGSAELVPRFWWARASVALGAVPLSIAAAPLESVARELVAAVRRPVPSAALLDLAPVAGEFLAHVSARLLAHRDFAGAIGFAERAFQLDRRHRGHLEEVVRAVVALPAVSPQRDPAGARVRAIGDRLQRELAILTAPDGAAAQSGGGAALPPPPATSGTGPPVASAGIGGTVQRGGAVRGAVVLAGLTFVGVAAVWYLRSGPAERPDSVGMTALSVQSRVTEPRLTAPPIERVANLSQLDAVMYALERGGRGATSTSSPREAPTKIPRGGERETTRAVVDTRGPLEPADVLKARTTSEERSEEDVGAILFGAPKPRLPRDGTPGPGAAVEVSGSYAVMVRTRVMARPSFTGAAVAELAPGDTVVVEGGTGDWLKIRSRNGRVGYILAQDAARR